MPGVGSSLSIAFDPVGMEKKDGASNMACAGYRSGCVLLCCSSKLWGVAGRG